jgi:hypothetical protein
MYIIRYIQAVNNLVLNYPAGPYKTGQTKEYQLFLNNLQTKTAQVNSTKSEKGPFEFIFADARNVIAAFTKIEESFKQIGDNGEEMKDNEGKPIIVSTNNKHHKEFCAKMKLALDKYEEGIKKLGDVESVSINDKADTNVQYIFRLVSSDVKILMQDLKNNSPAVKS